MTSVGHDECFALIHVSGSRALLETVPPPPRMQVATHFLAQPCTSLFAISLPRLRGADPSPEQICRFKVCMQKRAGETLMLQMKCAL